MEISAEFKSWLDEQKQGKRKEVSKIVGIEVEKLFDGKLLSQVISIAQELLEEHGDILYIEKWDGHEDMYPSLSWIEAETDKEYSTRIKQLHKEYLKQSVAVVNNKEIPNCTQQPQHVSDFLLNPTQVVEREQGATIELFGFKMGNV